MSRLFLYLIGIPGSGKSTLLKAALDGAPYLGMQRKPFAHERYLGGDVLGWWRPGFSGTDTLSMSVQPLVVEWLAHNKETPVAAEGDRLANSSFFKAVRDAGFQLDLLWLDTPADLAAQRRAERGSEQNEVWLQTRVTKVRNLVEAEWSKGVTVLDGSLPLEQLVEQLRERPVIEKLLKRG